ncbi:Mitochondrial membrane protein Pet127 [Madurella fahalii]|uniref:Mitochondrial membrane protein Pet127 n=1 Tax=Madurella fahalii TaxID=1157608 RepID=A0ABQ0G8S3_9PEZI
MLSLARQARSTLKSPFICLSCRVLLASSRTSAPTLPSSIARFCATRHCYSTKPKQQKSEKPKKTEKKKKPKKLEKSKKSARPQRLIKAAESLRQRDSQNEEPSQQGEELHEGEEPHQAKEVNQENGPPNGRDSQGSQRNRSQSSSGRNKRPQAKPSSSRIQLWRETLEVLKDLQAGQGAVTSAQLASAEAAQPSAPPDADSVASGAPSDTGQNQVERVARTTPALTSLKNQPSRQSKLLEGALAVLKRVLHQESQLPLEKTGKGKRESERIKKTPSTKVSLAVPEKAGRKPELTAEAVLATEDEKKKTSSLSKQTAAGDKPASKASKGKPTPGPNQRLRPSPRITGGKRKGRRAAFVVETVDSSKLQLTPVEKPQPPVPRLAYGLDRVLFNPGVYHIQDPRSRVFNFDPYLARIMPIEEFDFNALKQYVTSSKDSTLISTAAEQAKKYSGSTSSMTTTLAHFHYLLSAWRRINPSMMSRDFEVESHNYTRIMRAPAATFLHWKDGTYAIDADKEFDTASILSMLGKSMEKFLTLPKEDFEKYRRTKSDQLSDEERNGPESYHYTTLGDFMMRSQLDAFDPRIPGTGMFDLKTRAVISIRMEAQDFHKGMGYEIRKRFGQWESFEREYYDMIRSAFLKYSLQVRMGRMDGIFVAFHNTQRIFGFQYISLPEMDLSIHGQSDLTLGDREFKLSVHLLNKVLDRVTAKFPGKSLRLHFETREGETPFMYVFAKPVTPAEIEEVQGAGRAAVEEFEQRMMGITREAEPELDEEESGEDTVEEAAEEGEGEEETSLDVWEDVMHKVEHALENEEHGVMSVREAIEYALKESGLLESASDEETERCIDAFLEALTSNVRSATPVDPASVEPAENQLADEEGASGASWTEDAASGTGSSPNEADEQQGVQLPVADGVPDKEPTLKDLILRLASQLRDMPSEQRTSASQPEVKAEEDAPADMQRLGKVVKILSELIVQPRKPDDAAKWEGNGVIERGSLSAEDGKAEEVSEPLASEQTEMETEGEPAEDVELYGLLLTVRNKVNGKYVQRPEKLTRKHRWVVEYAMEDIQPSRARTLYSMLLNRRKKLLDQNRAADDKWSKSFRQKLERFSQKGRAFRTREIERAKPLPVFVYGSEEPYTWESVFEHGKDDGTRPYVVWQPGEANGTDSWGLSKPKAAGTETLPRQLDIDDDYDEDFDGGLAEGAEETIEELEITEEDEHEGDYDQCRQVGEAVEETKVDQGEKADHETQRNEKSNDENKELEGP